jgi:glutathione S-transferase
MASADDPIRLWSIPFSTNVERVRLALGHKGLAYEIVTVDPDDRSEVRRVSGQDLVPVLQDGDAVVADSLRILEHLERHHPDPRLMPADPARRAETTVLLEWFDRVWKGPPNEIDAELGRAEPDRDRIAALSGQLRDWLAVFEGLLDRRRYLMGPDLGAADCAVWPFLRYALGRPPGDDDRFHQVLEEHLAPAAQMSRVAAWIRRVGDHPR